MITPSAPNRFVPIVALLVAMVSIQVGASLAERLFPIVGSEGATALRVGLAAPIMLALWRPWRTLARRGASWWPILVYGAAMGLMNLLFYRALRTTPLGLAVALEFAGPLAVALLSSRRAGDVLWAVLAAGGLALLLPFGTGSSHLDPGGVSCALGAGAFWALYIVIGRRAAADGERRAVTFGTLIAAVLVVPVGLGHAGLRLLDLGVAPLGILVALLTSVVPYSLEMHALARLPTRTFGILMSAEPAVGVLAGLLVLGEAPSARQALAVVLIIIAAGGTVATAKVTPAPIPN